MVASDHRDTSRTARPWIPRHGEAATAKARETRALQKAFEEERETCAIVKVVLAPEDVVREEKGFEFFLSPKPLPWGFVVEAVI